MTIEIMAAVAEWQTLKVTLVANDIVGQNPRAPLGGRREDVGIAGSNPARCPKAYYTK